MVGILLRQTEIITFAYFMVVLWASLSHVAPTESIKRQTGNHHHFCKIYHAIIWIWTPDKLIRATDSRNRGTERTLAFHTSNYEMFWALGFNNDSLFHPSIGSKGGCLERTLRGGIG